MCETMAIRTQRMFCFYFILGSGFHHGLPEKTNEELGDLRPLRVPTL